MSLIDPFLALSKLKCVQKFLSYINKFCKNSPSLNTFISRVLPWTTFSPYRKIAFAKTHKTASSTVQNILLRYGLANGVEFLGRTSIHFYNIATIRMKNL